MMNVSNCQFCNGISQMLNCQLLYTISVDGKMYHVRVESHTVFRYYLHEDWRSVVFEQVSTYDVNGVKGYGIFEFLYRSVILLLSF